ncbi:MAG TPA: T9SS type A sorting domain-containing protein, partial [Ignavibacteriaceae bacterium]
PANKVAGPSFGNVGYDIVDQSQLTNDKYQVTFFKDSSSSSYSTFWRLKNLTTGQTLVDSSLDYLYSDPAYIAVKSTDGFIIRVEEQIATLGTPNYTPSSNVWYDNFDDASATGVFYVGKDIPQGTAVFNFRNRQSDYISADRLRKVELRFGTQGKAYRYLNNYIGSSNLSRLNAYTFAGAVTAADTIGKGTVGNWNTTTDRANGYVDVPFTAWVVDDRYPNDSRQLAVGFVERRVSNNFPGGNPDGNWDPGDSLNTSGEVIIIFDASYDQNGQQIEYTGGEFNTPGGPVTVWSDLLRATTGLQTPPADAIGFTPEQRKIYLSPWFNAMYVVGLQKKDASMFFNNGDVLSTNITVYPYTSEDIYEFTTSSTTLNEDQQKALFEKVNVYPNPLYGFNVATSYTNSSADEPFVTFSNLPEEVSIKVYSLSGQLLRTLGVEDKTSPTSPFLTWNLQNESGLRVASGMYFAIVESPKYGEKILKFAIIMPQKQIQKY